MAAALRMRSGAREAVRCMGALWKRLRLGTRAKGPLLVREATLVIVGGYTCDALTEATP